MSMIINHSFDSHFVSLLEKLQKKYGEEMFKLEGISRENLDINRFTNKFLETKTTADISVDANANVNDTSMLSWNYEFPKALMKLNSLYHLWTSALKKHGIKRANKMIELEIAGGLRIHDLHGWLMPYCWAASLAPIINEGMPWVKNIRVKPVKHFDTLISNSIKYIYNLSTQCVGAIAVPDLLAYAEYFIRKDYGEEWYNDEASIRHVKQGFQQWIYGVNDKARGNQSPFTNVSIFDKYWRKAMFENHTNPDFSTCDLENLKRTQRLFVDVMIEEQIDNPFTFPVMTACQLKDPETGEIMDKDWLDWLAGKLVENKLVNIYTSSSVDSLSSCCRLRNNINPLLKKDLKDKEYTNSFGVGGLSIGSHRVVALNLPQIAYIAKCSEGDNWTDFFRILESRVKIAQDILDIHRETLKHLIKNGNLPMYQYGCMDLSKQYSTVGFIGLFEALEILGLDIRNPDGTEKGKEIISLINKLNDERTAVDGNIRNVEQIPGESAAVTFAAKDKLQFANVDYELYSNQYIPLIKEALMADRIRIQGEFDESVSGGSILHIDVDQELTKEQIISIIEAAAKMNVIYFALDDCLAQCKSCGKVYVGKYDKSPCHNSKMQYYMRVVGFRTPVESWNKTRRVKDFPSRYMYDDSPFM